MGSVSYASRTLLVPCLWLRRLYQSVRQQTAPSLPASTLCALCKMATEWWFSVARFKERSDTEWIAVHVKYSQLLSVGDWSQRQGFYVKPCILQMRLELVNCVCVQ